MSIQTNYEKFDRKNPHVYVLFKRFANNVRDAGFKHYSSKAIFERIRWHVNIETKSPDGFKLNCNFTSRYSRKLVEDDPTFDGFFRHRTLTSSEYTYKEPMLTHIYDIESYPNVFTLAAKTHETGECRTFEISFRRNDVAQLLLWVESISLDRMVGFNNYGFDYPILHFILGRMNVTPSEIYTFMMGIIDSKDRFSHVIWDNQQVVSQVDLFKIHHFDNIAKMTSLKVIEFNMRENSVMDLPYPPGTMLTSAQIDHLIVYNHHDVEKTEKFMIESKKQIEFREYLSKKYERNFLNHNDTKIGKDYLIMELGEELCFDRSSGSKKPMQTHRPTIAFKDIIFPYVRFNRPEFNHVLEWLQNTVIDGYNTKDCIKVWSTYRTKGKVWWGEWQNEDDAFTLCEGWKIKGKPLSCNVDGFDFVFGTGGIHGSIDSTIVTADADECILDLDVTSYYPSLGIVNRLFPEHLTDKFCDVYGEVKRQRATHKKGTPENAMLKLALNGTYGDTNNKYSPFYDPRYTMSITVNGQLLLCMLAEQMMEIPGLQMIQINTDGLTVKVNRQHLPHIEQIKTRWCATTGLELEEAFYKKMCIRDVNNYIAEGEDEKVKRKGAYEYEMGWHQNHSALIVQKAAESYLIHGESIFSFVKNHKDEMDFMLRTKVPHSSRLELNGKPMQNVTRYYISTTGGSLIKIMPPLLKNPGVERKIGINVKWKATECNTLNGSIRNNINYKYYIEEAVKLVSPLIEK